MIIVGPGSPVMGCVTVRRKEAVEGAIISPDDTPLIAEQMYVSAKLASTLQSSRTDTSIVTSPVVTGVLVIVTQLDPFSTMALRFLPESVLHWTAGVGLPYATQVNFTDCVAMAVDSAGGRTTIAAGSTS